MRRGLSLRLAVRHALGPFHIQKNSEPPYAPIGTRTAASVHYFLADFFFLAADFLALTGDLLADFFFVALGI